MCLFPVSELKEIKHFALKARLLRQILILGIYWVTYEKIKSYTNQDGFSLLYSFLGGSISGAVSTNEIFFVVFLLVNVSILIPSSGLQIAAIVTNPFDVVKTLHQINFIEKEIMTGKHLIDYILILSHQVPA